MQKIPWVRKSERGQSLVELGIGMVVLLTLLAGIIDLGRMMFASIALRDATQEGAVVASLNPFDCQNIKNRISSVAGAPLGGDGVTVTIAISLNASPTTFTAVCVNDAPPTAAQGCAPNNVRISANATFKFMAPFVFSGTIPLKSEITETILQPPCN